MLLKLTLYSGYGMLADMASTSLNLYNAGTTRKLKNEKAPNVAIAQFRIFRLQ